MYAALVLLAITLLVNIARHADRLQRADAETRRGCDERATATHAEGATPSPERSTTWPPWSSRCAGPRTLFSCAA